MGPDLITLIDIVFSRNFIYMYEKIKIVAVVVTAPIKLTY